MNPDGLLISPDKANDPDQDEDDEDSSSMDEQVNQQESEEDADKMDTDDSMASSDAYSCDRRRLSNVGKKNGRKSCGGQQCDKLEEHKKIDEKLKVEEEGSEIKGNSGEISKEK